MKSPDSRWWGQISRIDGFLLVRVVGAMGTASDSLSQSAAIAQDVFEVAESNVLTPIKKNPLAAVTIAALIGLLIGKMS